MNTSVVCLGCQAEIPNGSRFCPQCGAPQSLACTACGHINAAGSRYCTHCGGKFDDALGGSPPFPPAPSTAPRVASSGERRQITVMFCDMVGSTALSTRLDPEDLRDIIAAYHKCAAEVVERFNGFVAKYMGDGVLVYFGYPEAHEDDAENAVRAGLAIVQAIAAMTATDGGQKVRVGIATGLVVVGELIGSGEVQERNVIGETPNLAARLQSAASPNTVVIASSTRRLTGDSFEYESVDPGQLKGFDGPVAAWRVLRERSMQSRFEALSAANQAPLVGRVEEFELLLRRWAQIKDGAGRVVLISGEPGIGKSRLTGALTDKLSAEHPVCLRYFCLPHHQGSALQPVVAQLSYAAGFGRDDTPAIKRDKIEKILARGNDATAATVAAFFDLLGLSATLASGTPMDPQRKRAQVLTALLDHLNSMALRGPVLMIFEDAQWSDPTSLELLTRTVDEMQTLPILLVITFRPGFQPPWAGQPHVTSMALNRLSRSERIKLVGHVTGGKALPAALLEQIVDRTDGVPLFVEELTKSLLESEQIHQQDGQYVLDQPAQPLAIPTTLQGSLMARVDRLGSAREVLQIGAAIGREFSYELLTAVAGMPDTILQDALARLIESELLVMRGTPPDASFSFKHALVQDAAYSTMLRSRRQQLHGAIASLMEKRFTDVITTTPEIVAQQFESAAQAGKAIQYWRQAGNRDLRRFAMKESIAHYTSALRLVAASPQTPEQTAIELSVCLELALAEQISLGPTSQEAMQHYQRGLALAASLPDRGRERFLATWGIWFNATMSGRTLEAYAQADDLLAIARELKNSDLMLEAYHARVPGLLRKADFPAMREASEEVIRLYDRERHRDHAFYFGGHDSRVCAQSFHAISQWALGFPDRAQQTASQCIEDARTLGHAFSLAHGLNMGGLTHLLLGDMDACRAVTDELYPLAERNRFPWPLTYARFMRAWLLAQEGDRDAGIAQMLAAADGAPAAVLQPILLTMVAQQQMLAGRADDALSVIERATQEMERQHNHFYEAEMSRLKGEILLTQSRDNAAQSEAAFRHAMTVAVKQSCRALELSATTSLARLLGESGRAAEAYDLLAPVHGFFTEGFSRPDLQAAVTLLAKLTRH
ncbi:MAG TPA: adenylate/guanylate cyclase domain-containing protein [Tepidisphaeraceae bacterium]|nr:adenylate/guanylate cyclase domain-containing protein [Tepidisphaeraceae bacterium]